MHKHPLPTVDVIIEYEGGIVLIERKNPPYGWALPGGFVEYGESLEVTAMREVLEETSLKITQLRQFYTYSDPKRDPRMHTITTVYIAQATGQLKAASDAKNIKVFSLDNLPTNMAFDHAKIIQDYIKFRHCKKPVFNEEGENPF